MEKGFVVNYSQEEADHQEHTMEQWFHIAFPPPIRFIKSTFMLCTYNYRAAMEYGILEKYWLNPHTLWTTVVHEVNKLDNENNKKGKSSAQTGNNKKVAGKMSSQGETLSQLPKTYKEIIDLTGPDYDLNLDPITPVKKEVKEEPIILSLTTLSLKSTTHLTMKRLTF
ncbi:hypothetical protein DXG01_005958 [Tephrocybe rancida]|nr:hypothetical protein DXG01_005958 [Tephrocybe rancida]